MGREIYSGNWDNMSFVEQKEYMNRKLSYFIRTQLYPYSPFYRRVFDENKIKPEQIRKVEDLRRIPFTYKADIAPTPENPMRYMDFVLQPDEESMLKYLPKMLYRMQRIERFLKGEKNFKKSLHRKFAPVHMQLTTGTTGLPTPILYAAGDVERMIEAGRRIIELVGYGDVVLREKSLVVNVMPFAPHLGFWMVSYMLERAGILSFNTGGGRALGTERIIEAIEKQRATGIVGMPGYVYHLLRTANEKKRDFSSVRLVLVAGERIPYGMKEKIGQFLESMGAKDVRVLGALGFTEGRKAYSECAPDGDSGYHIFPDMDYFEIVDPITEEPVGEGEDGELVYTCLEGQGTCVLRFRTGDFVKGGIVYEPCPSCGRKVPRLSSDIVRSGREKGFSLSKVKGTLVNLGSFSSVLSSNPRVVEWQVEIRKAHNDPFDVDVLDVFIAPAEGTSLDTLREEIEEEILKATDIKPNTIHFLPLKAIEERLGSEGGMGGIKELRVVDKRPIS